MQHQGNATRSRNIWDSRTVDYANWVIKWRWPIIILTVLVMTLAASGVRFLGFSTDYRVFFSDGNPQLAAFEELQDVYTKDDNIMFVIKPANGDIFTPEILNAVRELSDSSWKVPYSTRVDSITNFQHSYAEGDDLTVVDLVGKLTRLDEQSVDDIRQTAIEEPLLLDKLISPSGETTAININLTLPGKTIFEVPEAMEYARNLAQEFRESHPDLTVAITGLAALNHAFSEASMMDMQSLVPLMYGVLLIVLIVLLRSFSGTFATFLVIGFSAATAMGLAGWFGILLTPPSSSAPTIILTLAIADSVHVLITMLNEMRKGTSKKDAMIESIRINFYPVFLTSFTTVIGFLSLNFSDAPPFRDLGNISAMGVTAAWIYSIMFLPALLMALPVRVKVRQTTDSTVMERFAEFVIGRRRVLLWGSVITVVALTSFIPRIQLNDQFVNYFDDSIEFRRHTDFAMENLSGIYQMQFSLPSGETNGISTPEYLDRLDAFVNYLRQQPEVVHVQAMTDVFNRLNKNMHGDDPAYYSLPDNRELGAQYLLLFEMSLPYGLDLNNQINVEKSSTRLIATLKNITTREARILQNRAEGWLQENFETAASTHATGPFTMFAYISKRNIEGMLIGTTLALVLISITLMVALRNVKLGAISLVPNLLPAAMAFGLWGIFIGQVGLASSIVTATSLGIVVDATVHFLSKYQRARRLRGDNAHDAVRYAFSTVGTALWVTSAVLIAGFAILSLSSFELNKSLGLLTTITLACALIADFLLLPILLIAWDKKDNRSDQTQEIIHDPLLKPAE